MKELFFTLVVLESTKISKKESKLKHPKIKYVPSPVLYEDDIMVDETRGNKKTRDWEERTKTGTDDIRQKLYSSKPNSRKLHS